MRPLSAAAALAAVFLSLFMASGLRLTDDGLRAHTRATSVVAKTQAKADENQRPDEATAAKGPSRSHVELVVRTPRQRFALLLSITVPSQLAAGAYAFGTSLPKRSRWSAIGGHGRHGPGARI